MLKIPRTLVAATMACTALGLAAVGAAVAQDNDNQDDQRQDTQREDRPADDQQADDQQAEPRQREAEDRRSPRRQADQARSGEPRQPIDRRQADDRRRGDQNAGLGVTVIDTDRQGAQVNRVHRGSPAEAMGLQAGDLITRVNGQSIRSARDLIFEVRNMRPDEQIELQAARDNERRDFSGRLEPRAEALAFDRQPPRRWERDRPQRGSTAFYRGSGQGDRQAIEQLESIERQLDRLSREVDDLRYSMQQGASRPADDVERRERDRNAAARVDDRQGERRVDGRQFAPPRRSAPRQYESGSYDADAPGEQSPGGELGAERTRPDNRLP